MPDGEVIECPKGADTLEKAICKLGLERVLSVDYENMLIASTRNGLAKSVRRNKIRYVNGFYTSGGEYRNEERKRILLRIVDRLDISTMKVEVILG